MVGIRMKSRLPSHIDYDHLDSEGWPVSLNPNDKAWAVDVIGRLLAERGQIGLTLNETHHRLFEEPDPTRTPRFIYARSNLTWEKAVAYKVLSMSNTNQVWVLYELRKEVNE